MPDLHLVFKLLRVDLLIDLKELKAEEVHGREESTSLHLLLIEFPKVSNVGNTKEALLRSNSYIVVRVILQQFVAIFHHCLAFFHKDLIQLVLQEKAKGFDRLVQVDEEVRFVVHDE